MNNEQFRRLLATNANGKDGDPTAVQGPGAAIESKKRASLIPMTPRTIKGSPGIDFARQMAENRTGQRPSSKSKFRTMAPRGVKLASGFRDRTKDRVDDESDDAAKRIKALEESFKLGEIEQEVFDRLRDEITGGDIEKTHLVKGLDFKLLERIRRGDDIHGENKGEDTKEESVDIDDEFEQLETKEVVAVQKEQMEKKGQTADLLLRAATKKTRDEILADLKASRKRARDDQGAEKSMLSSKFRKIGAPEPTTRLERDERGREVLVITDADGNVKRKVRKAKEDSNDRYQDPETNSDVLGADVVIPEAPVPPPAEDSDDDIYADVGDDYNPLGDMEDDDSDEEEANNTPVATKPAAKQQAEDGDKPAQPRNYFKDDPSSLSVLGNMSNPLNDPTILAALAQKEKVGRPESEEDKPMTEEEARLKRRAEMLSGHDRDLDDMDMGFGSSRHDDAADMDGSRVKISEWKGGKDDDEGDEKDHDGKARKRGPKKRKADKNNVSDVLKIIERQRQ
jgi:hypothetical protein